MTQASTGAHRADMIFLYVLAISVLMLFLITAAMIFFVIRYSRKRHPKAAQIEGNMWLEIIWTAVPLVVFVAIFYFGWTNYEYMANAPSDSMVVKVTGRQWNWSFEYPNQKQSGILYATLGKPMKLEVRSLDVIHGFFIPAFRLKIDAVPGRVNTAWFDPTVQGSYDIECTVICGVDHSSMLSKAVVVPEAEFKRWYFGDENAPPPKPEDPRAAGGPPSAQAVLARHDCLKCHSTDGSVMVGPSFRGLFGQSQTFVTGGQAMTMRVDEAQLRRSIQAPGAHRVKGYPPVMPATDLDAGELDAVVAFIRSLQ
jgi:cytochrome c oxidase subunit 2